MIINVRHELTSYDLAYAFALEAEVEVGPEPVPVGSFAVQIGKRRIREIAAERLKISGDPHNWPDTEGEQSIKICRVIVDRLWPKGA